MALRGMRASCLRRVEKAFFLRGGKDAAVLDQGGGAVVIERRETKNPQRQIRDVRDRV